MKSKAVKLSEEVIKKLDEIKHPGQTYDGVIRELLERKEEHSNEETKPARDRN